MVKGCQTGIENSSSIIVMVQEYSKSITHYPDLFSMIYNSSGYVMRVNHRDRAFVVSYPGVGSRTIVALAFDESASEFVFTTVLRNSTAGR